MTENRVDDWDSTGGTRLLAAASDYLEMRTRIFAAMASGETSVTDCLLEMDEAVTRGLNELDILRASMPPPSAEWAARLHKGYQQFAGQREYCRAVMTDFRPFAALVEEIGAFTRGEVPRTQARFAAFMGQVATLKQLRSAHDGPARSVLDAFVAGVDQWVDGLNIEMRVDGEG